MMSPKSRPHIMSGLVVAGLLLGCVVVVTVLFTPLQWENYEPEANHTFNSTEFFLEESADVKPQQEWKLNMVERKEWLAEPVHGLLEPLHHPVPYVIISHSATEQCHIQTECTFTVRLIQMFHIESRGWWDIGYNFLVGGEGSCFVGRGWDYIGSHSFGFNNRSIGINFIGTFNTELPPEKQLIAAKTLIENGVLLGKIASDYKLLAHRQVSSVTSPGERLYEELKTWPHWTSKP